MPLRGFMEEETKLLTGLLSSLSVNENGERGPPKKLGPIEGFFLRALLLNHKIFIGSPALMSESLVILSKPMLILLFSKSAKQFPLPPQSIFCM